MSLFIEQMEDCQFLNKTTESDGEGGLITDYTEGAVFKAAITFNNTLNAKVAQAQGVKSVYMVTTPLSVNLQYHDVIKRLEDGKIFRITSDGNDRRTPKTASFEFRRVSAEEWELPT